MSRPVIHPNGRVAANAGAAQAPERTFGPLFKDDLATRSEISAELASGSKIIRDEEVSEVADSFRRGLRTPRLAQSQHPSEVADAPWFSWAGETAEQKERALTEQGPHWLAKLPVVADPAALAALAEKVDVQILDAREELSIHLPGENSMPKYSTAVSRLVARAPEGFFPDFSGLRHILHEGGLGNGDTPAPSQ